MADNRDKQLNLSVLQRLDSNISSIIDFASQVALYKFSSKANEWEKTEVEGTLFVYMRETKPQHGIIVMNRNSTTNFIEPITSELEFQVQTPFILYRNGKGHIHGVWFYEQKQCKKIGILLKGLLQLTKKETIALEKPKPLFPQANQKGNSDNLDKMDIMSLLTRAQEEYDKRSRSQEGKRSPAKVESSPQQTGIVKPTPVRANGLKLTNGSMPITVDKLFAQVGDGKHVFNESGVRAVENSGRFRSYTISRDKPRDLKPCNEDILQKLMSNPASDLSEPEHNNKKVAKMHRVRSATYSAEPHALNNQTSVELVEQDLKKKLNLLPRQEPPSSDVEPKLFLRSESLQDNRNISRSQAMDIPILTPAMLELSSSLPASSETTFRVSSDENVCSDSFIASSFPMSVLPKPPSPTLLSPMDFKISIKNSSSSLGESPPSPPELRASLANNGLNCYRDEAYNNELLLPHNLMLSASSSQTQPLGVTPLTKSQLREALSYMIQNDDEFVSQLHECYLKSLKSHLNVQKSS